MGGKSTRPTGDKREKCGLTRGEFLKLGGLAGAGAAAPSLLSGCGSGASGKISKGDLAGTTVTVATVSNSQMTDMESLVGRFTKQTGIKVRFLTLPENNLRQKVTQDVAMNAGDFDVVTIGSYDTPIWAKYKWIVPLDPFFSRMSGTERQRYDLKDLLKPIRSLLSRNGRLFALPFYGESSMLFYRRDLFEKAKLKMPDHPKWEEVMGFARKLNGISAGVHGIILRGEPGWGANMAPFDTFINTYGGRWFNMNWEPQLTSPQVKKAAQVYSTLLQKYGQPGATSDNFPECETAFAGGNGAMWYDATSAAGYLSDPKSSKVADRLGFAYGPTAVTPHGAHWLWSWALAIESSSRHKDAAFEFIKWATSKEYLDLVGRKLGWERVPPGTRYYTYRSTPYRHKPWAEIELNSINTADPQHPTKQPVPYTGIQYVEIPEFQDFGDAVGRYLAALIAGKISVDQFVKEAQQEVLTAVRQGGYLKK
ncbi:MAG: sugar ABC transporter substrate-binding protein [Rubrobacteraceae bacterium]|nr:sugar ABC transporter substrate-binding protein [Rubrobacteraceae bacterium]